MFTQTLSKSARLLHRRIVAQAPGGRGNLIVA
jgi:hypothetical protein